MGHLNPKLNLSSPMDASSHAIKGADLDDLKYRIKLLKLMTYIISL
jgi:hypothetical protein